MTDLARILVLSLSIALGLVLTSAERSHAGWQDNASRGQWSGESGRRDTGGSAVRVSAEAERLARRLDAAWALCRRLPAGYEVDCIAEEYKATAAAISRTSELAATRAVLVDAAARLDRLVETRRDPARPQVRASTRSRGTTPITPVRPQDAAAVRRAAAEIVASAGLTLLRSVPADDPRAASFQRVASAFDDTAVLLRS